MLARPVPPHVQEIVPKESQLASEPVILTLKLRDVPFDLLEGGSLEPLQAELKDLNLKLHFLVYLRALKLTLGTSVLAFGDPLLQAIDVVGIQIGLGGPLVASVGRVLD